MLYKAMMVARELDQYFLFQYELQTAQFEISKRAVIIVRNQRSEIVRSDRKGKVMARSTRKSIEFLENMSQSEL